MCEFCGIPPKSRSSSTFVTIVHRFRKVAEKYGTTSLSRSMSSLDSRSSFFFKLEKSFGRDDPASSSQSSGQSLRSILRATAQVNPQGNRSGQSSGQSIRSIAQGNPQGNRSGQSSAQSLWAILSANAQVKPQGSGQSRAIALSGCPED